ncbi:MAG: DnaJ domain-containing protein [Hyphomicrobiales bacterium]
MQNFILALVIVFGGWWLLRKLGSTQPAKIRGLLRMAAGGAILALAGFLALRGAMNVAVPLFLLGLGFLGQPAMFPDGFPWKPKTPGQRSRVTTGLLAMELEHDTGRMDGTVLAGPLQGRQLSALSEAELRSLHRLCGNAADQSLALLEAWLDRSKPDWRRAWGRPAGGGAAAPGGGAMSRQEAFAVLGLKPGAATGDIRAAHRRLMKEFHPDRGGSDYLAAKINQAKDVLLQE